MWGHSIQVWPYAKSHLISIKYYTLVRGFSISSIHSTVGLSSGLTAVARLMISLTVCILRLSISLCLITTSSGLPFISRTCIMLPISILCSPRSQPSATGFRFLPSLLKLRRKSVRIWQIWGLWSRKKTFKCLYFLQSQFIGKFTFTNKKQV